MSERSLIRVEAYRVQVPASITGVESTLQEDWVSLFVMPFAAGAGAGANVRSSAIPCSSFRPPLAAVVEGAVPPRTLESAKVICSTARMHQDSET